jgi:hypothetical protein
MAKNLLMLQIKNTDMFRLLISGEDKYFANFRLQYRSRGIARQFRFWFKGEFNDLNLPGMSK